LAADPPAATAASPPPPDLRSPEQRDTRHSAYSLPHSTWALNVGALGIGGGDVFAKLGVAYGVGGGVQLELNLAHVGVGLMNFAAQWHFVDTRYFDLGAGLGFWYGHGDWFWIARGVTRDVVSKLDVIRVPVGLTASAPLLRWLQLDLSVEYTYGQIFGEFGDEGSIFHDAQIGARQLTFRPGVRWFISPRTSLELSAHLPAYTSLPIELAGDAGETHYRKVPFSDSWSIEAALRSSLTSNVFGNLRLHYGNVADALYGASLYPSFELEIRL